MAALNMPPWEEMEKMQTNGLWLEWVTFSGGSAHVEVVGVGIHDCLGVGSHEAGTGELAGGLLESVLHRGHVELEQVDEDGGALRRDHDVRGMLG